MEKQKNAIKSIIEVGLSNIMTIIAGIIIGLIIPKVITVEGYGFYKTFTLYVTYVGLFSLGIIDGIVLDFGGFNYPEFNRPFFRSVFKWYILIHIIWMSIITVIGLLWQDENYSFIAIMLSVYMLLSNIVGYFQQISQITQRFKEYSAAKIIQSVMRVLGGVIMIILYNVSRNNVDYRIYVCLTTAGFLFVTIGYFIIYKDIIFGESLPLKETKKDIWHFLLIGFPLLFANLCSTLILSLDRQFVNVLFSKEEYAIYAFAYNLLSLITVATSAISTVIYPILKRTTSKTLKNNYSDLISVILIFVYGALLAYFPLCAFIDWFLPKYHGSLVIFRIIFPGLAISSSITVIMHNYYKTLGDNLQYFKKSILILILSAITNTIAYLLFHSMLSISIASIITMIIWYLYIEQYFVNNYRYKRLKNCVYLLCMLIVFYCVTCVENLIVSGILYCFVFCLVTTIIYHGKMKEFLNKYIKHIPDQEKEE